MNAVQLSKTNMIKALVISLEADKAFDWAKREYLFDVLQRFRLDDVFIHWISVYKSAMAINGCASDLFPLS